MICLTMLLGLASELLFPLSSGLSVNSAEVKQGFKRAFAASWPEKLRYQVISLLFMLNVVFSCSIAS